jgi:GAF domain
MQAQPFTEKQIALLETFTEQAVIAINYTCLFEEVQAKTRQLQESLEYQTATSDVLGVISRSPNQLQPVLDTIVATSGRLCCADYTMVFKLRNGKYHLAAAHGAEPDFVSFIKENPISPRLGTLVGRTALEKRTIYIEDALSDRAYKWREAAIRGNYRTTLGVPLLCGGEAIGVIALVSKEVKAFTDREVKLVETFADQAVIAIENTRLFEEVQARNRDLTALGEVGRAVSSTLDLKVVLKSIIDRAIDLTDTDGGSIIYYRQELGAFELGRRQGSVMTWLQGFASSTSWPERRAWARQLPGVSRCNSRTSPNGKATPCAMPRSKPVFAPPSSFPCSGPRARSARWSCSGARRANFHKPLSA